MELEKIYAARVIDLDVFDPNGDRLGRVKDLVLIRPSGNVPPQIIGLIMEDNNKWRLFIRIEKIDNFSDDQVTVSDLDNVKKFDQRGHEKLVEGDILGEEATLTNGSAVVVEDLSFSPSSDKYPVTDFFVRIGKKSSVVPWQDLIPTRQDVPQAATQFVEDHAEDNPADFASKLTDLHPKMRAEIADELSDERLALVLAQMSNTDQVSMLANLQPQRVVSVLHEMEPDDAADIVHDLDQLQAEKLLSMMDPEDAHDMRRLLAYDDNVAGALMTPVPLILKHDSTVAEALAYMQQEDMTPANASTVFVCEAPYETPTGKYLGYVHFQQLLRTPPGTLLGTILDNDTPSVKDTIPIGQVVRTLATYDLVTVPVVNAKGSLVGAVTVDDVLDHILPEGWRDQDDEDELKLGDIRE